MHRLWAQKHKELGRFSGTLFRLVEAVIDYVRYLLDRIICICRKVWLCRFVNKLLSIKNKLPF